MSTCTKRADMDKHLSVGGTNRATTEAPDGTLVAFAPSGDVLAHNQTGHQASVSRNEAIQLDVPGAAARSAPIRPTSTHAAFARRCSGSGSGLLSMVARRDAGIPLPSRRPAINSASGRSYWRAAGIQDGHRVADSRAPPSLCRQPRNNFLILIVGRSALPRLKCSLGRTHCLI